MKYTIGKILSFALFVMFIILLSSILMNIIMSYINVKEYNKFSVLTNIDYDDIYEELNEFVDIQDLSESLPRRQEYNSRDKSNITGIVIHHTASDTMATPEHIANVGIQRFGFGHSYHYQILRNGKIIKTNPVYKISGHIGNTHNPTTIGIVLTGTYTNYGLNNSQLINLIRLGRMLKKIIPSIKTVKGHRDYFPNECPGEQVYKHMDFIEYAILNEKL